MVLPFLLLGSKQRSQREVGYNHEIFGSSKTHILNRQGTPSPHTSPLNCVYFVPRFELMPISPNQHQP
jgi:hypothetical protein